jgi:hypothetical protein
MKISYTLLTLALALVYGVVVNFFPDFPISQEVLLAFVVYVLIKLGVEITQPVVVSFLIRRGFMS